MTDPRLFVCGDIHGSYYKLMAKLAEVGFDRSKDTLYALGDLVDRGPDSLKVLRLLDEPWFESIKGNHELMLEQRYQHPDINTISLHYNNGGAWFDSLNDEEKAGAFDYCRSLPLTMVVTTPTGRKIGLVHAEIPGNDWDEFEAMIQSDNESHVEAAWATALWGRTKIKRVQAGVGVPPSVQGIDMVYMGHTPSHNPVQHANLRWIDTGACWDDGRLTMEELL